MTEMSSPYQMCPPVLSMQVEDTMDIMIVRDTTRRAASLLGFSPAQRAQLASAAASLAELVLKTGEAHTIHLNGVLKTDYKGLQISATTPWLEGISVNNIIIALRSKMGDLVDEILLHQKPTPTIVMVMWLDETTGDDQ